MARMRWVVAVVTATIGLTVAVSGVSADEHLGDLSGVPRADCGPGSTPETAQQGRVPAADYESGRIDEPYACNVELLSHHNSTGGFKVFRYVDADGTECAFYDSTLFVPFDLQTQATEGAGVVVLDMTDPTAPVQTTTLTTPGMLSPHESLVLNEERGLLAAVAGNPTTYPGVVDIYDVSEDCTKPTLRSSSPVGFLGHESGFSPDGRTLYTSSIFTSTIAAIDVSYPSVPRTLWVGNRNSHGMTVSDDGNRLYLTPLETGGGRLPATGEFDSGVTILDVSSIQAREPLPQPSIVGELTWPEASIAQTAIPVTFNGVPHLIEVDEFINPRHWDSPDDGIPGAARIIDISDETAPREIADIRLEVHDPEVRRTDGILDDPGADRFYQGYAAHYCSVPTRVDPQLVACSMILSGLRVFDITDPTTPREVAYFNQVGDPGSPPGINPEGAPYAMSAPAFVPEREEIWYSDAASGFYALRLTNDARPDPASSPRPPDGPTPAAPPERPPGPESAPQGDMPATGAAPVAAAAVLVLGSGLGLLGWRRRRR